MATIRLLKDHTFRRPGAAEAESHKAGAVVSVPYLEGKRVVEIGAGVPWDGKPEAPPEPPRPKAEPPAEPPVAPKPKAEPAKRPAEKQPATPPAEGDKRANKGGLTDG